MNFHTILLCLAVALLWICAQHLANMDSCRSQECYHPIWINRE